METGNPPDDRRPDQPEPEGPQSPTPDPQAPAPGPQSPAPGPQSPAPGPQSPAPGAPPPPPPPPGPQAPAPGPQPPPPGPQAPPPAAPPPGPESPPGYTGPVPPGGWQAPVPQAPAWAGDVPLAGWGSRFGAVLLDGLVILAACIALFVPGVVSLVADVEVLGIVLLILGGISYLVVAVMYGAYFLARPGERNGQTLGKQWVGIRAVRDNGQPFDIGSGLMREFVLKGVLFWGVGSWFLYIPPLLDSLWPLWDDQNRALHDMIASTHVVRA